MLVDLFWENEYASRFVPAERICDEANPLYHRYIFVWGVGFMTLVCKWVRVEMGWRA